MVEATKVCSVCKTEYPATRDFFYSHKLTKDNLRPNCKFCESKRVNDWQKKQPPEKKYSLNRKKVLEKYGMTIEDYKDYMKKQNGCCWICGVNESENGRKLSVDHDHTNGNVRGLLCQKCNKALGLFQDDPNLLLKAMIYLQNNNL